jgi:hypothetical protein
MQVLRELARAGVGSRWLQLIRTAAEEGGNHAASSSSCSLQRPMRVVPSFRHSSLSIGLEQRLHYVVARWVAGGNS